MKNRSSIYAISFLVGIYVTLQLISFIGKNLSNGSFL